jgi:hypothetical protein
MSLDTATRTDLPTIQEWRIGEGPDSIEDHPENRKNGNPYLEYRRISINAETE